MSVWPPQLTDLLSELERTGEDSRPGDSVRLQRDLDAAVAYVEDVRRGSVTFTGTPTAAAPAPDADLVLGTLRYAVRLHTRRRSPDGLVGGGELGSARVPIIDSDIERLLRIGRFGKSVVA